VIAFSQRSVTKARKRIKNTKNENKQLNPSPPAFIAIQTHPVDKANPSENTA
jgi:hypothetical protein